MQRQAAHFPSQRNWFRPLLGGLSLLLIFCAVSTPALAQTPLYTPTATASGTPDPTATPTATPVPVSRSQIQILQKTTHQWALFWWADNTLACSIFLDSEDQVRKT